jgi:preprotein translocase subunit SecF
MFKIIKDDVNIDFISHRKFFYLTSGLLCLISLLLIFFKGFNYGIDFAGGTIVQVKFENKANLDEIRELFSKFNLGEVVIQNFGSDREVLIRIASLGEDLNVVSDKISDALFKKYGNNNVTVERVEQVGPQIGSQLKKKAFYAIIYSLIGILIYLALRFELIYSVSSIIALFHDVLITCGALVLTGREMNITVLAALLTIVGYSVNDTIVIFDRIRENIKNTTGKRKLSEIINKSLNNTLSRTIITSGTVLLTLIALYTLGGPVINDFAFALLVGTVVGTYSTVGIACAFVYAYKMRKGVS